MSLNYKGKIDCFKRLSNFSAIAVKIEKLSREFKEVIVVAVAHALQCPYCIDVHSKNDKRRYQERSII
ncbi:carboxymuconolactone decarboxylase family protein [Lysinibacillus sp. NPDC097287]|uniref:carboxymuconolactone decarboxylase family protein n=1 Tax=Lysinibacillus sp. NPDC097287 TaxID=3364144 RepID=UPI0037FCD8E7